MRPCFLLVKLFLRHYTRTFNTTYTIGNQTGQWINGPIELLLTGLAPSVSVANVTGTFRGAPFVIASMGSVAPGASIKVAVNFSDPSNVNILATPVVYSGGF